MRGQLAPLGYEGIGDRRDRRVADALAAAQQTSTNAENPPWTIFERPHECVVRELVSELRKGALEAYVCSEAGDISKLSPRLFQCDWWDPFSTLSKGRVVGAGSKLDHAGLLGKPIFVKTKGEAAPARLVKQPKRTIAQQGLDETFGAGIPPETRNCELVRAVEGWCMDREMDRSALSRDTILRAAGRRRT
jgi:hypothetical protein